MPSARALMSLLPIDSSSAQNGTKPQWYVSRRRTPPRFTTTYTSLLGATLKLGSSTCSETASTSKYLASSSGGEDDTKRPHIGATLLRGVRVGVRRARRFVLGWVARVAL